MIAFFIFYNKATGIQRHLAFSRTLKHCDVVVYDGALWLMFRFSSKGIEYERLKVPKATSFLKHLKIIPELEAILAVDIGEKAKFSWRPFWSRSCNELCRYITGVDIGFTFNPRHMLNKLLKYSGKRNFQILYAWRRQTWDCSAAMTRTTQTNKHQI